MLRWSNLPVLTAAFAAYATLAIVMTFPLVFGLASQLPKDLGDPLIATAHLWWNAQGVPLTDRWWDGQGFFPARGMMAFSAHFLGASLIATPLQWMGLNAVAAYNVTFLASFALTAMAAHLLAFTLTRRHDAALVCGLAFGFNPFRIAHVEHLELLMAFGMPLALFALHRYLESRQRRWLAVFAVALALQALSASYYALFFTVFFALWLGWFMRSRAWSEVLAVCAAGAAAIAAVWPIIAGYAAVHASYNWRRDLADELLTFSADVSSYVTASPLSVAWGWTAALNGAERQLFPGLTISLLASAGLVAGYRAWPRGAVDRWTIASRSSFALSAMCVLIAFSVVGFGPWTLGEGWWRMSASAPYKPLSLATVFALLGAAWTAPMRSAFRRQSVVVFYLVAAAALFLCSLGPQPTLLGERVLYEPPYAWLMRLPFFSDSVRAPARFAMLGILALSVAASLSFHRLTRPRLRQAVLGIVVIGIVVDGWQTLPLAPVPRMTYGIPAGERPAAVLELPLGDVWRDTAAIYRSTLHGVRAVNGYNGFEPLYYQVLRRGLQDRDPTILEALAAYGPIMIAADNAADPGGRTARFLDAHPLVHRLGDEGPWSLFWLQRRASPQADGRIDSGAIAIAGATDAQGLAGLEILTDQDPNTRWIVSPHDGGDEDVVFDLGGLRSLSAAQISMGAAATYYPGELEILTSADAVSWDTVFRGSMAGPALRAALANPRDARLEVPLRGLARFIKIQAFQALPSYPWAIADIVLR